MGLDRPSSAPQHHRFDRNVHLQTSVRLSFNFFGCPSGQIIKCHEHNALWSLAPCSVIRGKRSAYVFLIHFTKPDSLLFKVEAAPFLSQIPTQGVSGLIAATGQDNRRMPLTKGSGGSQGDERWGGTDTSQTGGPAQWLAPDLLGTRISKVTEPLSHKLLAL